MTDSLAADGGHAPLSVAEIVRRHRGALLRFLRTRLRVTQDADDIAQESFIRLMQYEGSRQIGSPSSMLFRIAINVAKDLGRAQLARRAKDSCCLDDVELVSDLPSAERDMAASQELDLMLETIEKLSPKCREVFLMSRMQLMTYPEIARARGISARMVEKHISRALAACSKRLQEAARPAHAGVCATLIGVATALGIQILAAAPAHAAVHELNASPSTVHRGFFDASLPPVLTIESGDIVRVTTSTGNPRYFQRLGVPKEKIPAELFAEYAGVDNDGRGDHTLDGPIFVRGAEPGDTLEIKILKVAVRLPIAAMSFRPKRGVLPDEFDYEKDRVFWIDMKHQTIEFTPSVRVPVKPFWGVIGVAPEASRGRVGSGPPDVFGGNLDNRDICAGSSLFLPVQTRGGLVSIGDGHAVQGHGEVGLSAVEASLRGEVQISTKA